MNGILDHQVVQTQDGSDTIFSSQFNQHFHSIHGAMQESLHVYMKMGFDFVTTNELDILEIGFGTGLNTFLVARECLLNHSRSVRYCSIEKFPLNLEIAKQLNYASDDLYRQLFLKIHECEWNTNVEIQTNFILTKLQIEFTDFRPAAHKFDLIFFDAFSPTVQPELWTEEIFRKLFTSMKKNGILVSYCAKGQVRRNMIAAGFSVERLQGPPGKREMLRAKKNAEQFPIQHY